MSSDKRFLAGIIVAACVCVGGGVGLAIGRFDKKMIVDKQGKEWPECIPPDPTDPYGELNNHLNVNAIYYKCSSEGRWVWDQKAQAFAEELTRKQREFVAAISTRKLTADELKQLYPFINTFPNESYFACVKYAELYEMLVKQWEIQKGRKMTFYTPLSKALGAFNRCPQEDDSKAAVVRLIEELQQL